MPVPQPCAIGQVEADRAAAGRFGGGTRHACVLNLDHQKGTLLAGGGGDRSAAAGRQRGAGVYGVVDKVAQDGTDLKVGDAQVLAQANAQVKGDSGIGAGRKLALQQGVDGGVSAQVAAAGGDGLLGAV